MKTTTISILRTNIKAYIDGVIGTNEPLLVNKGSDGAVIISLSEYNKLMANVNSICRDKSSSVAIPMQKNDYYVDVDINEL